MSEPLVIEPAVMKDTWDCGIASLAMLLSKSYAEVCAAVPRRIRHSRIKDGLGAQQMRNIARRLGYSTCWIRDGDLQEIVGVLGVARAIDPAQPEGDREGHYLMVLKGVLYNPADGMIWTEIDSFMTTRRWAPTGVLVRED